MISIAFIDSLGLAYDGTTLTKRGLGGSESAVILMSRELAKLGFDVHVFNDCFSDDARPGVYDGVKYIPITQIVNYNSFDIVIGSRSVVCFSPDSMKPQFKWADRLPNFERVVMNSRYRILWMHDTFCDGDQILEPLVMAGRINEIFTLSDFHTDYVTNCDHGNRRNFEVLKNRVFQTRNGMTRYLDWVDVSQKDYNQFVFNASVTKGMIPLVERVWPRVREQIPNARLTIIGGYYKFREDHGPDEQQLKWEQMVRDYAASGINFTGVIKQSEIAEILAGAAWMIYPAAFPETFGISSLEALAYNTPILTCQFGALEETAIDAACYKIPYAIEPNSLFPNINIDQQVDHFVRLVVQAHQNPYLHQQKAYACNQVKDICTWDTVALQWKQHFYRYLGEFLPVAEYREVTDINARVRKVFGRRFYNLDEWQEPRARSQQPIAIITPVYNAEKYIAKCILSVTQQDYHNYRMLIINDASTDRTAEVIRVTVESLPADIQAKFVVINNDHRLGSAVGNQIETIRKIRESNAIVMLIDGDDWLMPDPNIFHKYNNFFAQGAEYVYGSCWSVVDNIPLIAQPYPPEVKAARAYRSHRFNWNMPYPHLRAFRKYLADRLDNSYFQDEQGQWYAAGGDNATFYNIIEQADPDRVICNPDVVYCYNDTNPINDYKVHGTEQNKIAEKILGGKSAPWARFSVIVPTMWRCNDLFQRAIQDYIDHDLVGEIVIIDNDTTVTPDWACLNHNKVRIYSMSENIGVNPAWNFGVEQSRYPLLAIMNDDIVIDPKVLDKVSERLTPDVGVFGIICGNPEYNQPVTTDGSIDFREWQPGENIHYFGQSMFLNKVNWTPILEGLIISYGDDFILYDQLANGRQNYLIYNTNFETRVSSTMSDPDIKYKAPGWFDKETDIWYNFLNNQNLMAQPLKKNDSVELMESVQQTNQIINAQPQGTTTHMTAPVKKILIGIPTARYIEPQCFKAIYDLIIPQGYEVTFQYFYGYNVDQVRNLIADWTVRGFDYLFSVDHDIAFPPDTLAKLLSHDKPVVTGVYRQRLDPEVLEVYGLNGPNMTYAELKGQSLVEVGGCGFGCVLVKKEVFVTVGYPQFVYHSALDHKNTFSEDMDFCVKARQKGFSLWCDPSILCDHHGNRVFQVNTDVQPIKQISPVEKRLRELSAMDLMPAQHVEYLQYMKSRGVEPRVIYDIGACVLHWTNAAKRVWPNAEYVLFDALSASEPLYKDSGYKYVICAVGDRDNESVGYYENLEHPGGNTCFKENPELSPRAPELYPELSKKMIVMRTLDSLVREYNLPKPDLIKMDIQGSELAALKGAVNLLAACNHFILELQHTDYNLGAPKREEVIAFMQTQGFECVAMFTGDETTVDGDYHFVRRQPLETAIIQDSQLKTVERNGVVMLQL